MSEWQRWMETGLREAAAEALSVWAASRLSATELHRGTARPLDKHDVRAAVEYLRVAGASPTLGASFETALSLAPDDASVVSVIVATHILLAREEDCPASDVPGALLGYRQGKFRTQLKRVGDAANWYRMNALADSMEHE